MQPAVILYTSVSVCCPVASYSLFLEPSLIPIFIQKEPAQPTQELIRRPIDTKRNNNTQKYQKFLAIYLFVYKQQNKRVKMSGKGIAMNQHRDWISQQRVKLTNGHSKVILPRLANQESLQHKRIKSIKKKDEDMLAKSIKDLNMDSSRVRNSQEGKSKTSRSIEGDSAFKDEKFEVIREMKGWINFIENTDKDEERLQDHTLPKLQKSLKKWCFFIEQMFSSYQKLENSATLPMKAILLKSTILSKQLPKKTSEPCEIQLKVQRQYYDKQTARLAAQIKVLEEQTENNRANNIKSIEKIEELERLFGDCLSKIKRGEQVYKDSWQSIRCILIENQSFLNKLKESIATGKETVTFQERIDFQLANLREYKAKYCIKDQ